MSLFLLSTSLTGFFEARFGNKGTEGFRKAQRRFIESLAAYSIACYLLQIKDRWRKKREGIAITLCGVFVWKLVRRVVRVLRILIFTPPPLLFPHPASYLPTMVLKNPERHNGNILLDAQGRLIHIDFGFMLANSPGGNLGFESAPFKLTQSFIKLMGGTRSRCFRDFRRLCVETFLALRRNSQVGTLNTRIMI